MLRRYVCFRKWLSANTRRICDEVPCRSGTLQQGTRRPSEENNLVAYLTDNQGRRYYPIPDNGYVAFNVLLRPNESAMVSRSFLIPESAKGVGAVITHEGGFPIGWLIIDYDTWFRKPPLVPLS